MMTGATVGCVHEVDGFDNTDPEAVTTCGALVGALPDGDITLVVGKHPVEYGRGHAPCRRCYPLEAPR